MSCSWIWRPVVPLLCLPWLFPLKPLLFESWCKWFPWCRLSWQRFPLHCRSYCQRTCLLHVLLIYIDLCCMFDAGCHGSVSHCIAGVVLFKISPYCYSTWCRFVPPLVMSKYVKPPTWKKAAPLHLEDCSIIPSYLPLCCKFSGWLCKRLQWASPAVQWGEVLPKK